MRNTSTYKAITLASSGQIQMRQIHSVRPKADQIVVAPLMVGVCGTDLQILQGMRLDPAKILGHEGVAEVVEIGSNVTEFAVGQQVVFNPVNPYNQNDILGHTTPGLFQQSLLVSQSARERGLLVAFDPRLASILGPLVEPLGTVVYGQSLVNEICQPKVVAVVGGGAMGLLHILYSRLQGASRLFLISNFKERLNWVVERDIVSADEALLNSENLYRTILEMTNGQGVDAVYLCTTRLHALSALTTALTYVCDNGCIDLVGGFNDGAFTPALPAVDLNSIRRARVCGCADVRIPSLYRTISGKVVHIVGHRGTSARHLQISMELLGKHSRWFSRIVSHVIPFREAPAILRTLKVTSEKKIVGEEWVKGIIDFTTQDRLVKIFNPDDFLKH